MSNPERPSHVWDCQRMLRVRCPWSWDALDQTPEADVRHCRECDRDVHLCRTPADFIAHGERGRCVAIPDDLAPGMHLVEPSPEVVLHDKARADQGTAWWEEVLRRQTDLSAEQIEAIRAARSDLDQFASLHSPEHLAVLRMAVRDGGVRCPRCGFDVAQDHFGVLIFLATRRCERCQEPIELELPTE